MSEELESLDPPALARWLREKGLDESTTQTMEENSIDGKLFLSLTDGDLKDLFDAFIIRKRIRDIQIQQKGVKKFLERRMYNVTPARTNRGRKKTKVVIAVNGNKNTSGNESSTSEVVNSCVGSNTASEGNSSVSEGSSSTSTGSSSTSTGSSSSTIGSSSVSKGRGSSFACVGSSSASQRNSSANKESENSFVTERSSFASIGSNIASEGGSSAGLGSNAASEGSSVASEGSNAASEGSSSASIGSSTTSVGNSTAREGLARAGKDTGESAEDLNAEKHDEEQPSEGDDESGSAAERAPVNLPDRGAEVLDAELRKCTSYSAGQKVNQLLKLTTDYRIELASKMPKSSRVEDILKNYAVFKSSKTLIANLLLNISSKMSEEQLNENVTIATREILDYLYGKELCTLPRSALKTETQQIMVAFAYLPLVFKKEGLKIPPIVHIVKKEELFKEIAVKHRNSNTPWLLYQKFGGEEVITLMIRSDPICNVKKAQSAVLALMGLYYMANLPYPPQCNLALLYIQTKVLKDKAHDGDVRFVKKATSVFEKFQNEERDIFD